MSRPLGRSSAHRMNGRFEVSMKTATLRMDNGKFVVVDPREGRGIVGTWAAKDAKDATDAYEQINAELMAEHIAATVAAETTAKGTGRIEILSTDGKPVLGVPTVRATDAIVVTSKKGVTTTEMDLAKITGYVIVSRDRLGAVSKAYTNAEAVDFGRAIPVSRQALETLRGWFTQSA